MNHGGVCRTAPATRGLLNMSSILDQHIFDFGKNVLVILHFWIQNLHMWSQSRCLFNSSRPLNVTSHIFYNLNLSGVSCEISCLYLFCMWNHTVHNHSGYNININGHDQCASITLQGHWTSLHTHFITWRGGSCGISCWYLICPWNHTVHNQAHGWWVPLQMFASLHASQITWFQDAWNSYVIAWFCKLYNVLHK